MTKPLTATQIAALRHLKEDTYQECIWASRGTMLALITRGYATKAEKPYYDSTGETRFRTAYRLTDDGGRYLKERAQQKRNHGRKHTRRTLHPGKHFGPPPNG